jgi:prepilin-type N-terminal cleavage/methylation domain-containing protein
VNVLARLRARLRPEGGFTLVELITVVSILGIVLAGILAVFVAGIRAEVDMNERFQAQQEARLALASMRKEIRCAKDAQTTVPTTSTDPSDAGTFSRVTLTLGGSCVAGGDPALTYPITWCVEKLDTKRYALFRRAGSACNAPTGTKKADRLTKDAVFKLDTTSMRTRLQVSLPVDANPSKNGGSYLLEDSIMLRNAATVTSGTASAAQCCASATSAASRS